MTTSTHKPTTAINHATPKTTKLALKASTSHADKARKMTPSTKRTIPPRMPSVKPILPAGVIAMEETYINLIKITKYFTF